MPPRIFLLSPATCSGLRAEMLRSPRAQFELAQALRSPSGAPLGDVFSFLSGLYFRGKLAYGRAFARPPKVRLAVRSPKSDVRRRPRTSDLGPRTTNTGPRPRTSDLRLRAMRFGGQVGPRTTSDSGGLFIITPSRGLLLPEFPLTPAVLEEFGRVPIEAANLAYREPLEASARVVDEVAGPRAEIVLLGSVATGKYADVLLEVFGDRLLFPAEFVGRGDMSRGGLMLRSVRAGLELTYIPVKGAIRHGPRPPKLEPLRRRP